MNNILNLNQIKNMRECGKILISAMKEVANAVKPGVSTKELDEIAEKLITEQGAIPSFLNYTVAGVGKYPSSLCVSINSEIVHGIPSTHRVLKEGDIVSLDLGAIFKGICTDMAVTLPVGKVTEEASKLIRVTKECLDLGIKASIPGNNIGSIGEAVQKHAELNGFGVVRDFVGHGIGEMPHMDPPIPNYGNKKEGPEIVEGMALAIEPMVTAGDYKTKIDPNGWTVATKDGSLSAHFEHTIVINDGKPEIMTA